jgi:hypothetical protein
MSSPEQTSNLIILGDEAWTEAELRAALRREHCPTCHGCNLHRPALDEPELTEIVERARKIMAEWPPLRGRASTTSAGRMTHLRALADSYGINLRTLYRYLRREQAA